MFSVHSRYPAWRKPAQELKASDVVSSPKVLSIDTEPPQTVGLYVSQGLFPTKGVFTKWQAPGHDEEYNELKEPAAGLMFHLPNQKKSKNNEVNCNYYENKKLRNTLSPRTSHVYNAIQFKR